MGELRIPNVNIPEPYDQAEGMQKWNQAWGGLEERRRANAEEDRGNKIRAFYQNGNRPTSDQLYSIDPATGMAMEKQQASASQQQLAYDEKKHAALKMMATDLMTKLEQSGITDPAQAQQFADQYQEARKPYIQQVLGLPGNGDMPLDKIRMIADSTPGQVMQQGIQNKVSEAQQLGPVQAQNEALKREATLPYDLQKTQAQEAVYANRMGQQFNNQKEMETFKADAAAKKAQVEADTKRQTEQATRTRDAHDALALLDQAKPLIDKATHSGIGAMVDSVGAEFGASTKGADAAAQLKALGGTLVSKMPKMSGPQSDKDVLLYKEMAGQIGDPTVPASQKKAAITTIEEIQRRYAGDEQPVQSPVNNASQSDLEYTAKKYGMTIEQLQKVLAGGK